jgi:ubiquinone/menaquinone biosynthesis C-methylase UbiE
MQNKFNYEEDIMGISICGIWDPVYLKLKQLLKFYPQKGDVLEIGCGAGRIISLLRKEKLNCNLFACDISFNSIKVAKKLHGNGIEFMVSDALNLPYKDNSIDLVYAIDVVEHLQDVDKLFSEAKRILKNNGIFYIYVPCEANKLTLDYILNKINVGNHLKNKWAGHIHRFSSKELAKIVSRNNFKLLTMKYDLFPIGQIIDLSLFLRKEIRAKLSSDKTNCKHPINSKSTISWGAVEKKVKKIYAFLMHILYFFPFCEYILFHRWNICAAAAHIVCKKQE